MLAAVMMALVAAAPAARADLNKAAAHFEKGTRLYQVGEYAKALEEFKAGYIEEADPSFLYNTAQCYWRLGQEKEALLGYRRFLSLAPDTPLRGDVERKIRELEQVLEERAANPPAEPAADPGQAPPARNRAPVNLSARPAPAAPSRWPAWTAGIATLAFAGGAAALGLQTNDRFESLRNSCGRNPAGCSDSQINDIRTRGRLVNGLLILSGISAIATGIAIYATSGNEASAQVAFRF
jgi:tetratricopeptide (TPR) repeat protein